MSAPTTEQAKSSSMLSKDQQEWLNKRFENRPKRKSLQDRGVLPEGNYSGKFSNIQAALQRSMDRDSLSRSLVQRPAPEKLIQSGILDRQPGRGMSPALAAAAKKLERTFLADDLNQKLYSRRDFEYLQKRGIILEANNIAPSLQKNFRDLERNFAKDRLNHQLYQRPERHELAARGILPRGTRSSVVERAMKSLELNMRKDKVAHLLENRREPGVLQSRHVMKNPRVAASLQGTQTQLQKNLSKANLYHALKHRPSVDELQKKGYYPMHFDGEEDRLKEYVAPANNDDYKSSRVQPQIDHSHHKYLQRRSKNFHLTRILLKFVAAMSQSGKISLEQKGQLKDLIVDQDKTILAVAETFDVENDLNDFEDSLVRLASRIVNPSE